MSPALLTTFPPRPSFYHRISGPSHRHGPSLLRSLRERGSLPPPAPGSPALSLHRPRPSMRSAEEVPSSPQPLGGVRVFECMSPTPSPAVCSSQVSLLFAVGKGTEIVSPLLHFAIASLHHSELVYVCARGNLCKYGFLQKGKGGWELGPRPQFWLLPGDPLSSPRSWKESEGQGRSQGGTRAFSSVLFRLGSYCGQ